MTPRTLGEFKGKTLVLPDVRLLGDDEKKSLQEVVSGGKRLVVTGKDATEFPGAPNIVRMKDCPGTAYSAAMEKDFEGASPDSQREFFAALQGGQSVGIQASAKIATSVARTSDGHINVFFANFAGLKGGVNPVQTPQNGVEVSVRSNSEGKGYFLPFMGQVQEVHGKRSGDSLIFDLPTITKGAVFWYEP